MGLFATRVAYCDARRVYAGPTTTRLDFFVRELMYNLFFFILYNSIYSCKTSVACCFNRIYKIIIRGSWTFNRWSAI